MKGGEYHFAIGSAGSTTLIFQTILLPLLSASTSSKIIIEGGTHNPWAPPFDFIERSFLPILRKVGASVSLTLERPGFYPAGGGNFTTHSPSNHFKTNLELIREFITLDCDIQENSETLEGSVKISCR